MFRLSLISAAVAVLLLGGCGRDHEFRKLVQAKGPASVAVGQEGDRWSLLGPLIAPVSANLCQRDDGQPLAAGAGVELDVEGKLTGPGVSVDMRKGPLFKMTRDLRSGVLHVTVELHERWRKEGVVLSVVDKGEAGGSSVRLVDGKYGIVCSAAKPLNKLRAQPLYKALGGLLEVAGQKLTCTELQRSLDMGWREITVGNGIVSLGDVSYDMSQALAETVSLVDLEGGIVAVARSAATAVPAHPASGQPSSSNTVANPSGPVRNMRQRAHVLQLTIVAVMIDDS